MAYTDTNIYILYFIKFPLFKHPVLKVSDIHHGLGWITGNFTPYKYYEKYRNFLLEYTNLEDYWGQEQNLWDKGILKLINKYGKRITLEKNWYMYCKESKIIRKLNIVPFVYDDIGRITWREPLPEKTIKEILKKIKKN